MFKDAVKILGDTTAVTHGETVTYTRSAANGGGAASLVAVIGQMTVNVEDYDEGHSINVNELDFIFDAPITVSGPADIDPKRGDTILFNGDTYKVLPTVDNKSWRWSDHYRNKIRVHTKQVSA